MGQGLKRASCIATCRLVLATLMLSSVWVGVANTAVQAESDPWIAMTALDIGELQVGPFTNLWTRFSSDGSTLQVTDGSRTLLFDVETGAKTVVPKLTPDYVYTREKVTSSGRHVFSGGGGLNGSLGLIVFDSATGSTSKIDSIIDAQNVALGYVADFSPDLRFFAFSRELEDGYYPVLIDTQTQSEIDVSQLGLRPDFRIAIQSISADWNTIVFSESQPDGVGAVRLDRVITWDRRSGAREVFQWPADELAPSNWSLVDDQLTYQTTEGLLISRNLSTGAASTVATNSQAVGHYFSTATSRVIYSAAQADGANRAQDLYAWQPGTEPRLINRRIDTKRASSTWLGSTAAVPPYGSTVAFASRTPNLVEGIDDGATRIYLARFASERPPTGPPPPNGTWPEGPPAFRIDPIDHGSSEPVVTTQLSHDGRTQLIATQTSSVVIDHKTGVRVTLPSRGAEPAPFVPDGYQRLSGSGRHAFDFLRETQQLQVIDVGTLEVSLIPISIVTPGSTVNPWRVQRVVDVSEDLRTIAVNASSSSLLDQGFLVNGLTGDLLTPGDFGVGGPSAGASSINAISADGRIVAFRLYGDGLIDQIVRWDRLTGERLAALQPPDQQYPTGWTMSFDASTIGWIANDELRVGPRLRPDDRKLVDTPGVGTVLRFWLPFGPRVLYEASEPGGDQYYTDLYIWNSYTSKTQRITKGLDGVRFNAPVTSIELASDGSFATFVTGATNVPTGATDGAARVYRVTFTDSVVPPVEPPVAPGLTRAQRIMDTRPGTGLGGATLQSGETRCVPTVDTMPGEFVVLNVTPVRATGSGFGTVRMTRRAPPQASTTVPAAWNQTALSHRLAATARSALRTATQHQESTC
jgi:hypothetical protein